MMSASQLKKELSSLVLEFGSKTHVSEIAALEVLDRLTLAVVPFSDRDTRRITDAITRYTVGAVRIAQVGSAIGLGVGTGKSSPGAARDLVALPSESYPELKEAS